MECNADLMIIRYSESEHMAFDSKALLCLYETALN